MIDAIHASGSGLSGPDPRGGFFLWAKLPEGVNADALLERAVAQGVIFVTGTAFFVDGTGDTSRTDRAFSRAARKHERIELWYCESNVRNLMKRTAQPTEHSQ